MRNRRGTANQTKQVTEIYSGRLDKGEGRKTHGDKTELTKLSDTRTEETGEAVTVLSTGLDGLATELTGATGQLNEAATEGTGGKKLG